MQRTERALGLVCALLPFAGVLVFGWSLATVLFMIWLDTWLHTLRIIPALMLWDDLVEPAAEHPVGRFCIRLFISAFIWLWLSSWLSGAGLAFHELAERIRPGGFRAEFHDLLFHAPWLLAIIVGGRLFPCARELIAARAGGSRPLGTVLKAEFLLGMSKCFILLPASWFAPLFADGGFWGMLAFAALASVTIVAADWYVEYRLGAKPANGKPAKPLEVVHTFDGRTLKR